MSGGVVNVTSTKKAKKQKNQKNLQDLYFIAVTKNRNLQLAFFDWIKKEDLL